MRSLIGFDQLGEKIATKIASNPVSAKPPTTVTHAARRGFGTSRSGTATDSANSTAPSRRPQNGAHATNGESSLPNADGIAEKNMLLAEKTINASVNARSWSWRLRRKRASTRPAASVPMSATAVAIITWASRLL